MIKVFIKENSWIAKIAAYKLKADNCAIVIHRSIYLFRITKKQILHDKKLLNHELTHILQWRNHGVIKFVFLYLYYSLKYGYQQNPFEIEARNNENNFDIVRKFTLPEN